MSDNRPHVRRDIAAGETFRHGSFVTLDGNIGAGAIIEIENGGVRITGNVGDGVTIRTRGHGSFLGGIRIEGHTGDNVTLDTDERARLKDAGNHLRIRAGGGVTFGHVGDSFNLHTRAEVNGGDVGKNAHLRIAKSCLIAQAGDGSIIEAGSVTQITAAGHDCKISCGELFNAAAIGADTEVKAAGNAMVGLAHATAKISAKSVHIKETADDRDFAVARKNASFNP